MYQFLIVCRLTTVVITIEYLVHALHWSLCLNTKLDIIQAPLCFNWTEHNIICIKFKIYGSVRIELENVWPTKYYLFAFCGESFLDALVKAPRFYNFFHSQLNWVCNWEFESKKTLYFQRFCCIEQSKLHAQVRCAWKTFITSGPDH